MNLTSIGVVTAVWAALAAGAYAVSALRSHSCVTPLRDLALLTTQQDVSTERPDALLWMLAPALYLAFAAAALALVPLGPELAAVDSRVDIVLWGAMEACALVAMFMSGWSANAVLPLIAGYRFVAMGASMLLISMFVLIAACLPAESMRLGAIVESQSGTWNLLRQPLGLPLLLCVGLAFGSAGPFDFAVSADLAGGASAELSGPRLALWNAARTAMRTAFAALSASLFLGGWWGPVLPGVIWLMLKTGVVLALMEWMRERMPRLDTERGVLSIWAVLLPLSFLHLACAGVAAMLASGAPR